MAFDNDLNEWKVKKMPILRACSCSKFNKI